METPVARKITAWAACFATTDAASAARLRLRSGIDAAIVGNTLWLRGNAWDSAIERQLATAAPQMIYSRDAYGALTPLGNQLPTADLPETTWLSIAELLSVDVPTSLLPASRTPRLSVRLVRSSQEQPATALLTDFGAFSDWCDTASGIRLDRLRAALRRPNVLVLGMPLPTLVGTAFYECAGVLLPCGFALFPVLDGPSLRTLLKLSGDDMAIFDQLGWHHLPAAAIAPVSRASIRLTRLGDFA